MNRTARLVAVLVIALVAATVASFAVYRALSANAGGPQAPQTIDTIVAAQPIPAGTMVTRAHIKVVPWPANARLAESISNPADVLDRGAIVAIALNEPITPSKLAAAGAGAGLPPTIPPGMRAISVRVNEVVGVAGFVVPGTHVDVFVTLKRQTDSETRIVVSNVQVLTAGTRYDQEKAKTGEAMPSSVVTLLLTPEDAERTVLASSEGQVMLALRNPLDAASTATAGTRTNSLFGEERRAVPVDQPVRRKVAVAAPAAPVPPPAPPPPYVVEAIRAAKRSAETVR
jgi:pilus assembly protein CpaB